MTIKQNALESLGWDTAWAKAAAEYLESVKTEEGDFLPGRVVKQFQNLYTVAIEAPTQATSTSQHSLHYTLGEVRGRLRHEVDSRTTFPVVGDWVMSQLEYDRLTIHGILPRRTKLSRKVPGAVVEEQPLVANIDLGVIVMGLDGNFNLRRLERFLAVVRQSSTRPIVALTKRDLVPNADELAQRVKELVGDVAVFLMNAKDESDISQLRNSLTARETLVLLGSSGVGKSTLTNMLLGDEAQRTSAVRASDSKGRHTTTNRELRVLPNGTLIIDTPGIRELQLWDDDGASDAFEEIIVRAAECRFRDCRHEREPGCAVQAALADGSLDAAHYEGFRRLRAEQELLAFKQNQQMALGVRNNIQSMEKKMKADATTRRRSKKWGKPRNDR